MNKKSHQHGMAVSSTLCRTAFGMLLLMCLTLTVYYPAMQGGFVWDDDDYVTNNLTLRSLDGLRRIWFEFGATRQYYPLVYTTFWIEHQVYGLSPAGYHVVNIILHGLASTLLWRVLRRLELPGAFFAAAVFAVHPVHVESVAWITERKNVLSGVFFLAAIRAFLRIDTLSIESGSGTKTAGQPGRARRAYTMSLFLYLCALLSKSVTCCLPAVLLLLAWWKRGRLSRRDWAATLPMFALGVVFAGITAWLERTHVGAGGPEWDRSFAQRFISAGWAFWFYVGKLLWPHPLIFIYPQWRPDAENTAHYLPAVLVIAGIIILVIWSRRLGRGPLVAVLYFLGTLLPALGFFNVYYALRYSPVADHFVYLASIGLFSLVAAVATAALQRLVAADSVKVVLAVVLLAGLSTLTWRQSQAYHDEETLWRDTINKNESAGIAHLNLGAILQRRGDDDGAIRHYERTLEVDIPDARTHFNLGTVLQRKGRIDDAIAQYRRALDLQPDYPKCLVNLGIALLPDDAAAAEKALQQAVTLQPDYALAHANLGQALERLGRREEAKRSYELAIQLNPHDAPSRDRLSRLSGP